MKGKSGADEDMEALSYPVGRFDPAAEVPHTQRPALIDSIAAAPDGCGRRCTGSRTGRPSGPTMSTRTSGVAAIMSLTLPHPYPYP
ncbi:MAG: hypothetical protein ACT443_11375 [Gemmatimonadota bacterium]